MDTQNSISLASRDDASKFEKERSRTLDHFAKIEASIAGLLLIFKLGVGREMLSCKMEKLRKAKPMPSFSQKHIDKMTELLDRVESLMNIRNDLVHAQMKIVLINEISHAQFIPNHHAHDRLPMRRLVSEDDWLALNRDIAQIANELKQILNQPSSKPQPSPAAKVGP